MLTGSELTSFKELSGIQSRTRSLALPDLDDRIDRRITHVLGTTVVPMFNALIETSGEHRAELIALRTGVQRIERRLHQHHTRLKRLELLIRDGCTNVVVQGATATGAST